MIRIQFQVTDLTIVSTCKFALYSSIRRHILKPATNNVLPTSLYLYPHHYQLSILEWRQTQKNNIQFTRILSSEQANEIAAKDYGHERFKDYCNSVY